MKRGTTSQSERKALRSRSVEEGAMKRGTTSKSVKKALRSRYVEEGSSGQGDLMMRRVPKDAAIGRKAGKSRRVKNVSTKLKAAAAAFEVKKPAAGLAAVAEAGKEVEAKKPAAGLAAVAEAGREKEAKKPAACLAAVAEAGKEEEAKKPAAGLAAVAEAGKEVEAKKPATAVPADAAESETTGKEGGPRLPQKFVDYVLSWKSEVIEDPDEYYARMIKDPTFSQEYVERSTNTLRDVAEICKLCADMMVYYKAWVCAEYEEKGYVEVDDDYIAEGVRHSEELEEDDEEYHEAYHKAFGPMDGVISESTPQSQIDEIFGRISEST